MGVWNLLDLARGVEEAVARRDGAGDDELGGLALCFQRIGQREHGAEAVAVGPDVRGQQESLMASKQFDEGRPVHWHGEPFGRGGIDRKIISGHEASGKSSDSEDSLAEKELLRRLAQQPLAVVVAQEVELLRDEVDARPGTCACPAPGTGSRSPTCSAARRTP